jgi:hypothetical protein
MILAYFEGKRWSIKSRMSETKFVRELSKRSGVKEHAVRQVLKHFTPTVVDNVSHLRYVTTPIGIFYGVAKRSFNEKKNGGHYARIITKLYNSPWRWAEDKDFTAQGAMTSYSARSRKDHWVYEVDDDFMELHKEFMKSRLIPETKAEKMKALGLGKAKGISKDALHRINYVKRHKEDTQYVPTLDAQGRPQLVPATEVDVDSLPVVLQETVPLDPSGTPDVVSRETEDSVVEDAYNIELFDENPFDDFT